MKLQIQGAINVLKNTVNSYDVEMDKINHMMSILMEDMGKNREEYTKLARLCYDISLAKIYIEQKIQCLEEN